jgi:hypothetical protein
LQNGQLAGRIPPKAVGQINGASWYEKMANSVLFWSNLVIFSAIDKPAVARVDFVSIVCYNTYAQQFGLVSPPFLIKVKGEQL